MKYGKISLFLAAAALLGCAREMAEAPDAVYGGEGLVISADFISTRTDISEGKSSWEAGDAISVVYDGKVYSYKTTAAGAQATFTSDAGIQNYDASKGLTAYYPETDATGKIVVASGEIHFLSGTQSNAAHAPLVGTPKSGNLSGGVLKVAFKNVCSVIELKVDAGTLTSPLKSLTVTPASADGFEGYLAFGGTVDPSTLAITTSGTGNSLIFSFPDDVDLTKGETIKFPVGRFKSPSGLLLTFGTADGKTYEKTIYKSGIQSYSEKDGSFSVKHFAKAMFSFGNDGGIASAADFVDFAAAVNKGESLADWQNGEGAVVLLNDIDMSGVTEWAPIGQATFTWSSNVLNITGGTPFTGHFDGQGHKISGLKLSCANSTANTPWGLFSVVGEGAVVENLVFDETCSLDAAPTVATDIGLVAGLLDMGTVRNIVNKAPMTMDNKAADNVRVTMGIVGFAYAGASKAYIENVHNEGAITAEAGKNTKNGATGVQVAGILGFGTNLNGSTETVVVKDCVNDGNITGNTARASGIVAAANRYTALENCVNNGNNLNSFPTRLGARIGNITCITGDGSSLTDCVNYGDIVSTTAGAAGGVVCLVNHNNNSFTRVKSYGKVITDNDDDYSGTFFGLCGKTATFTDCVAGGDYGTYNNGSPVMVGTNAENYFTYIGVHSSAAVNVTPENIRFGAAAPAKGINTVEQFLAFRDAVNAGGDLSPFYGDDGKTVVLNRDLDLKDVSAWTPIGAAVVPWASNKLSLSSGNPFSGDFDGCGHTISNFAAVADFSDFEACWGLFGVIKEGSVKNLKFDSTCSFSVVPTQGGNAGLLAGMVWDGTVSGIVNDAPVSFDGKAPDNKAVRLGAIVGFVFADLASCYITDCTNNGAINATSGGNTKNGATGINIGGIAGFGSNNGGQNNYITNCINNGDMNTAVGRCAGIVGGANYNTVMKDCVNNGNNTNSFATKGGARIGNITCILGGRTAMEGCVNNGDIISTTSARVGGLVSLVNHATAIITDCTNNGKVVSDEEEYRGTIFGYVNSAATFRNVIAKGDVGKYNNGSPVYVGVNAENYMQYVGAQGSNTTGVSSETILYDPAPSSTASLKVSIMGDSISSFAGWTLPGYYNYYPEGEVNSATYMWWYHLIYNKMSDAKLEVNDSWSGTAVAKCWDPSQAVEHFYNHDFVSRFIDNDGIGNPDAILIHGGANDCENIHRGGDFLPGVPFDTKNIPTADDLKAVLDAVDAATDYAAVVALPDGTFCQAMAKLLKLVQTRYPSARVAWIVGDFFTPPYESAIKQITGHFGYRCVDLLEVNGYMGITTDPSYNPMPKVASDHPNRQGMEFIADYIYTKVGSYLEGK